MCDGMCNRMVMNSSSNFFLTDRQGFTLVEVMVTLVVIAIAAAIATPSLMAMAPNMALKTAARDLYSKFQEAKMLAIKENNQVRVRFNGSYYYIDLDEPADPGYGSYTLSTVDTFTDENGDGLYNTGEPYNDINGDGEYSGEIAINFTDYGYGINLGTGNATARWDGNSCDQIGALTFNSRGSSNTGTIYLENQNKDVSYAVAVRTAGSIKTLKYSGASPFHKKYWQ